MNLKKFSVNNIFMGNFNFKHKLSKSHNKRKAIINIVLLLVSIGILVYFCIQNNNLKNLLDALPKMNIYWLAAAFFSMVLSWYCDSRVIRGITLMTHFKKYSNLFFFKISMVGQYFTALTPLGIAGQPMQIAELCKYGVPKNTALIITARKFFVYQSVLTVYSVLCASLIYRRLKTFCPELKIMLIMGIIFQSMLVFLIVLFSINKRFVLSTAKYTIWFLHKIKAIKDEKFFLNEVKEKLDFFVRSNKFIGKNKKANLKLYILTFFQLTFLLLVPFFIFKALNHYGCPAMSIICTQCTVNTISSFTPLPGASGTAEKGFTILFESFFKESEVALAMILTRFISFYFAIILGIIFYKISFKKSENIKRNFKHRF